MTRAGGSTGLSLLAGEFDARVNGIAALAEPVRRDLYRYVASQPAAVSRERAAEGVGVAVHVAKFHLDKMVDDGLLDFEYRRPPGRRGPGAGRPAKVYRRSRREFAVSLPERRYEFAGQLLARAVTDADREGVPVADALRQAARAAGRSLAEAVLERVGSRPGRAKLRDAVTLVLEESGYEPRGEPGGMLLANCPFHSIARDYTELACGMNLDLVKGLLARLEDAKLFAKLDPGPDRCCVKIQNR